MFVSTPFFVQTPLFYLLVPNHCITSHILQEQLTQNTQHTSAENKTQTLSKPHQIILTRDDLLNEGYQQTKRAWTEQEDNLLIQLCRNQNARFEDIALQMEGRNAKMCYSRFRRLINQSKDCWSQSENKKLMNLITIYGMDWKTIALQFKNRNYKQLKDHYQNYLREGLNKNQWTVQQDLQLINWINKLDQNWRRIEQMMPGRSRNQLKNRYFGRIKRLNQKKIGKGSLDANNSAQV